MSIIEEAKINSLLKKEKRIENQIESEKTNIILNEKKSCMIVDKIYVLLILFDILCCFVFVTMLIMNGFSYLYEDSIIEKVMYIKSIATLFFLTSFLIRTAYSKHIEEEEQVNAHEYNLFILAMGFIPFGFIGVMIFKPTKAMFFRKERALETIKMLENVKSLKAQRSKIKQEKEEFYEALMGNDSALEELLNNGLNYKFTGDFENYLLRTNNIKSPIEAQREKNKMTLYVE